MSLLLEAIQRSEPSVAERGMPGEIAPTAAGESPPPVGEAAVQAMVGAAAPPRRRLWILGALAIVAGVIVGVTLLFLPAIGELFYPSAAPPSPPAAGAAAPAERPAQGEAEEGRAAADGKGEPGSAPADAVAKTSSDTTHAQAPQGAEERKKRRLEAGGTSGAAPQAQGAPPFRPRAAKQPAAPSAPPAQDDGELAWQSAQRGDTDNAQRLYLRALDADPTRRDALLALARLAHEENRSQEAARYYEELLALDPYDPEATAGLAMLRGGADPLTWESRLRNVLARCGENYMLYMALGELLGMQHRWAEAAGVFARAARLQPEDATPWFNSAVAFERAGALEAARESYRRAAAASGSAARQAAERLEFLRKASERLEFLQSVQP